MRRGDGGIDLADRLLPPQVAERPCDFADWEITSICADYPGELRGFEPLTSARSRRPRAVTAPPLPGATESAPVDLTLDRRCFP